MKSVVCPELSTAAAGSSQAPTAAVDNSAPSSTHPEPTYKSRETVQITGTTSGWDRWSALVFIMLITPLDLERKIML